MMMARSSLLGLARNPACTPEAEKPLAAQTPPEMTLYFAMLLFLFPTNNIKNQKKRNPPGKDSCGTVKTVPYKPHQSGAMRPAGQHTGKLLTPKATPHNSRLAA
ncbi:MAG: hypothetical protein ACLTJ6_04505 [Clostridia bacterium]